MWNAHRWAVSWADLVSQQCRNVFRYRYSAATNSNEAGNNTTTVDGIQWRYTRYAIMTTQPTRAIIMNKVTLYLRVSTEQQQASGLGLEAQAASCLAYAKSIDAKVLETFKEQESGKVNERPELLKAIEYAKLTGSTLVIAKLDRLSRNAAFLINLKQAGVKFIAADMPNANSFTVGIMALVAQQELEAISQRTKDALKAAKARGTKLGNPNGAAALRLAGKGNTASVESIKAGADSYASNLKTTITALAAEGIASLGGIAKALNERDIVTRRGGIWHKTSVANLLARLATA